MVDKQSLKVGTCYFLVTYSDHKLQIPKIDSLIYVGKNLLDSRTGNDIWYFQDAESYLTNGSFNVSNNKDPNRRVIVADDEESLDIYLDLDGLIEELMENKKIADNG